MSVFAGVSGESFWIVDETYIYPLWITSLVFRDTIVAFRIVPIPFKDTHFSSILTKGAAERCCYLGILVLGSKGGR
jgi:hypothetical protein